MNAPGGGSAKKGPGGTALMPAMPEPGAPAQPAYPQQQQQAYPQQQQPAYPPQQPGYPPQQPGYSHEQHAYGYAQQPAYPPQQPYPAPQQPYPAQQQHGYPAQQPQPSALRVADDPDGLQRHIANARHPRPVLVGPEPLRSDRKLNLEANVVQVLDACERLHYADKEAEQKKSRYKLFGWLLFVPGIFTVWFFGIGLIFLIPAGFCWWAYRHVSAGDVEDRKLELIRGVLTTIGPELKSGRAVKLAADFGYHDQQQPMAKHHAGDVYGHWWLSMRFVLADGSTVVIDGKTYAKVKKRRKRKYTKVKDRSHERLSVRIAPPRGKSFHPSLATRRWERQQFSGLVLRQASVAPRAAEFEYQTPPVLRTYTRMGWRGDQLSALLDANKVVSALIASYKLAANAERQAEGRA